MICVISIKCVQLEKVGFVSLISIMVVLIGILRILVIVKLLDFSFGDEVSL